MYDICIIGGGASGMVAAITAKELNKNLKIVILEKKESLGKKLLATGNGRCNITNSNCINWKETDEFFRNIGVILKEEDEGRMYPYDEDSKSVLEGLMTKIIALQVKVVTDFNVLNIKDVEDKDEKLFHIDDGKRKVIARKVLLACGGKAAPDFGTIGDGYKWAKKYGHTVTNMAPILTGIDALLASNNALMKDLAGVRAKGLVKLLYCDKEVFSEKGEVQFTKDGLSGIVIFNMTRFITVPEGVKFLDGIKNFKIIIDFYEDDDLTEILEKRRLLNGFTALKMLNSIVRKPLARGILLSINIEPEKEASQVTDKEVELIKKALKSLEFSLLGIKGWKSAQATMGGIVLTEVEEFSQESKLRKGLFLAGEILDWDGPCGGYNLQNAWETGIRAGRAMAR